MTQLAVTIPWAQPFFLGNEENYLIDAFRSTWIMPLAWGRVRLVEK